MPKVKKIELIKCGQPIGFNSNATLFRLQKYDAYECYILIELDDTPSKKWITLFNNLKENKSVDFSIGLHLQDISIDRCINMTKKFMVSNRNKTDYELLIKEIENLIIETNKECNK